MTKEELYEILHSDFWKELNEYLEKVKNDAKDTILGLNYTDGISNLVASTNQAKIEIIEEIFSFIDGLKSDSE